MTARFIYVKFVICIFVFSTVCKYGYIEAFIDGMSNCVFSVSTVKCMNCKAVSDTFDPYLDIALDIKVLFAVGKKHWFLY